jgi:two-component system, OmpR family, phosphate regulon response regulator PhoB
MIENDPCTILVADDDPDILELVGFRLEQAGHVSIRARDGAEALELAHSHGPALCVLDVLMPKLSGFEVLRAMREDDLLSSTPVIMLTASVQDRDVARGFEVGADDYMRKPFNPRELQARVEALLRRNGATIPG